MTINTSTGVKVFVLALLVFNMMLVTSAKVVDAKTTRMLQDLLQAVKKEDASKMKDLYPQFEAVLSATSNTCRKNFKDEKSEAYSKCVQSELPEDAKQILEAAQSTPCGRIFLNKLRNVGLFYVVTIVLCRGLLSVFGFGSVGIAAGSFAASIQSSIGNLLKGSILSIFQRFGMRFAARVVPIVNVLSAVYASYEVYKWVREKDKCSVSF